MNIADNNAVNVVSCICSVPLTMKTISTIRYKLILFITNTMHTIGVDKITLFKTT